MWIIYSILAALFWGVWGVVAKFISADISPYTNHFLFTVGMLLTLPFVLAKVRDTKPDRKGIIWGLVAGVLAVTGNIAVYKAFVEGGLAAIVIPVTNLYPLVTIIIAILVFKEKLNWVNAIGILFAIPAVVMLSGQALLFQDPESFFRQFEWNAWLLYSFGALFFWGVFSAAQKVTTNYISAEWSYVSFIASSILISLIFISFQQVDFSLTGNTWLLGSLAGLLNGLGVLASFAAYSAEGKASKVTTIAGALQPVFTIVLAIMFLSENLSAVEYIGITLAMIGALTLSYEKKSETLLK